MTAQPPQPSYLKGVVKQVLSGDSVIIRGLRPKGGPPPERQLNFSNVISPRLARRATSSQPETQDEPWAWESREYLRNKLIGKEVLFLIETTTPNGREYGTVYIGKDVKDMQSVTELMVSEGLLSLRRESIRGESNLVALEDVAKAALKGKWNVADANNHVRDVKWTVENSRAFVDRAGGKPIKAIIEHVRDGSTVRAFLVPDFYHITLMISGIRCPMFKVDSDGRPDKDNAENFAKEARYFVESKLLQREVDIILETYNNNNFVGTIKHPNGNIAEALLKEGFAKCVDWSMATVTGGPEKLRAAEKVAKNKKIRLWTDYKPSTHQLSAKEREITGKVSEIVNGDALVIKMNNGKYKKVFLASIRPPRSQEAAENQPRSGGKNFRLLYGIPWLYEAREFLRKKLIGQKVHATVDYIQPAQSNFPEKVCCTVKIGDVNVAEAMVSKGLATVVKYRQDDDQRASCYDDLLSAEAKAVKDVKGMHSKKDVPIHRVADISGDASKSKNFLPFLQRAGRTDAVVEFVASGSRMRLYIPKETCLITFLLAGISCPKATRPAPGGGGSIPGEPYGAEALEFTKDHILQREVQIEVESMDKGGNFIGFLHFDNKNLSVLLVEHGLSSVHGTAEGTKFFQTLTSAEESAKAKKLNRWANFVEKEKDEKIEEMSSERNVDYKPMVISEVTREAHIYGQYHQEGQKLVSLMDSLRQEFQSKPPVGGAYTPRRGDVCAAKFVDGDWYRAKVEKVQGGQVSILYIDYGNREVTNTTKLASLPQQFVGLPPFAHEMALALVKLHKDEDYIEDAITALMEELMDREVVVNREYKNNGLEYCTVQRSDTKKDVAKTLLEQGLILVDPRKDKRIQSLQNEYRAAQDEAKKKHLNIWQYGDVTEDDAFEFGMER